MASGYQNLKIKKIKNPQFRRMILATLALLIQIAEEMEYDQQIDDNPAVLYDQAGSEEEC